LWHWMGFQGAERQIHFADRHSIGKHEVPPTQNAKSANVDRCLIISQLVVEFGAADSFRSQVQRVQRIPRASNNLLACPLEIVWSVDRGAVTGRRSDLELTGERWHHSDLNRTPAAVRLGN